MKIQKHHIAYEPEWTVDLPAYLHRALGIIHRTRDTADKYVWLTSFVHAVMAEWNLCREKLDSEANGEKEWN